jgi:hypothetical protein
VFADFELTDSLGNRLTIERLEGRTLVLRICQDDGGVDGTLPDQDARVVITVDEIREMANAVLWAA